MLTVTGGIVLWAAKKRIVYNRKKRIIEDEKNAL